MTDDRTIVPAELLQRAFSRKHNSLAAYIIEAAPYMAPDMKQALAAIQAIAGEDALLRDEAAAVLESLEQIPRLAPHSESVSHLNYLSVSYLCSVLEKDLVEQINEYEQAAAASAGDKQLEQIFARLLSATTAQLTRLQSALQAG